MANKIQLFNDNFQNYKRYGIPKAQLVIADIPYNLGANAYASSTEWYINGDNKQGESKKAGKAFFNTDHNFNIAEYMHFCSRLLKPEPKETGKAPAMIVFCSFEQMPMIAEYGKKHGFHNSYPLFFIKNTSSQVLKANMRIVGATEHAVVLYRDKLPKFNNGVQKDADGKNIKGTGKMIKNWFEWSRDNAKEYPKIHPTQKPVGVLKELIKIFTDEGDVVIDPCAGSGTTLRACGELNRKCYGFEIDKRFYKLAQEKMLVFEKPNYEQLECWRLMRSQDEHFQKAQDAGISNSQLYKQAGNSIVVDVLEHIFMNLLKGDSDDNGQNRNDNTRRVAGPEHDYSGI